MTTLPAAITRPVRRSVIWTALSAYVILIGGAAGTYALWTPANGPLLLPLALLTICAAFFFLVLTVRQGGGAPVFQIGGFFGLMTYLYAAYPMIVYLARGMTYGPSNDGRLYYVMPTPAQLGRFEWWYLWYFVAFAVVYLAVTRHRSAIRSEVSPPPRGIVIVIVATYAFASVGISTAMLLYPYPVTTYADTYLAVQNLPSFVRQIVATVMQAQTTLLLMIFAVLFANYRKRRLWIVLMLGWIGVATVRALHARTMLFLLLFVAACLYHTVVRRISIVIAGAGILVALLALAWLGAMRNARSGNVTAEEALGGSSEFEVILGNAVDLEYSRAADGVLLSRPIVYISDFAALVPQQLFPLQKQTKAEWYLQNYWPQLAEAGGGFAFGTLAEGVTGFGTPELFVRGLIVGLVFGLLHRHVASVKRIGFWMLVVYLWFTVMSYHSVRNTTFCLLQWSEYQLLLPIIGIRVTYFLLSRGRQRLRSWRTA